MTAVATVTKKSKTNPKNKNSAYAGKKSANGVGKDRFGARIGTNTAKFNSVLSGKPKTMKQLMEAAGLSDTFYNHVGKLIQAGYIEKVDDGFKVAAKK